MTKAERVLDRIRESEKDGSQVSQYSGELLRKRSSEKFMPPGRHLVQEYDQPGSYVTLEDQEVNRWWDCSQKQSWTSSWISNSNGEIAEILSGLRSIEDWLICRIRTPDSITSDRIWCRCSNMWLKLMRIPECGITELTEFTTRELRSSESSSRTLDDLMIQADGSTISSRAEARFLAEPKDDF